jgi:hypothetical protein
MKGARDASQAPGAFFFQATSLLGPKYVSRRDGSPRPERALGMLLFNIFFFVY